MAYPSRYLGRDFELLRREMDRLFNDVSPARASQGESEGDQAVWAPRADMAETEDAFVLSLDVPGVSGDDLQVTLEEDTLKVSGERRFDREQTEGQYHRIERAYGRFERVIALSGMIDPDSIEAELRDGVLSLTLRKKPEARPQRESVAA